MTEVVSIRFRNTGKVYFFAPGDIALQPGDFAIVETAKGIEYGECAAGNHMVDDALVVQPLRPVVRRSTPEDDRTAAHNREKEASAFLICQAKIEEHKLDMKLVDVEYSFDGGKILFFFTSDGRVDFRELVKDLVGVFRARIELRQIGVRDGAKMLGGLGICGREFCCSSFLDDFHPVSIKMAKVQSLSLNPAKISGTCGRLMCCLKYEQAAYEDLVKAAPKNGASIVTPKGQGTVMDVNLLRQTLKVRVDEGGSSGIHVIPFCDIGQTVSRAPEEPAPAPRPSPVSSSLDRFVGPNSDIKITRDSSPRPAPEAARAEDRPAGDKRRRKKRRPQQGQAQPQQQPNIPAERPAPRPPKPQQQAPKAAAQAQPPKPRPIHELKKKLGEAVGGPRKAAEAPASPKPAAPEGGGAAPEKSKSGRRHRYYNRRPGGNGGAPKAE